MPPLKTKDYLMRQAMQTLKPSNPKDALGILKIGLSVLPIRVLYEMALGMLEGALKYGRHNYRVIGVRASVYYDATNRHLDAFWEGEDIDPASGLHHVTKALTSLMVLRDAMIQGNWVDDRPPRADKGWMDKMNAHVTELLARYPNPVPAYTAEGVPLPPTTPSPEPLRDPPAGEKDLTPIPPEEEKAPIAGMTPGEERMYLSLKRREQCDPV